MVNPTSVALTAMIATAGLLVVIAGWFGVLPDLRARVAHPETGDSALRVGLSLGLGFLAFVVTQWPVAAFYGGVAGWFAPLLSRSKLERKQAVEKVEALAVWVESLRDMMAGSAGLQEAIRASADIAPPPIRREVRDLALRLRHESVVDALRRFAADVRHPLSDMVAASLILATSRHAGSLRGVLAMTAKSARETAALYRQVESGRTQLYSQSRMAGWISSLIILFMILARRDFLSPFDSFGGQIALFVICSIFFGSAVTLYRLGRVVTPRRIFEGVESWDQADQNAASPKW